MTFEAFLTAGGPAAGITPGMRRALAVAVAVHAALLVAAVVHAGWRVDEVKAPAVPLTLIAFAPPPPAAAPAEAATRTRPASRRRARTAELVQPTDRPAAKTAETTTDPQATDIGPTEGPSGPPGDRGEGGPPATFVAPNVASGRLAIDPRADPYRIKLPPALARAGMRLWLLARLCVRTDGSVATVTLIRGADPALDPIALGTLRTWRYRPYAVNGRPVPFCTSVRYEIATQ
jgi:protein TonB